MQKGQQLSPKFKFQSRDNKSGHTTNLVKLTMVLVVDQGESVNPRLLVEVHQHPLLQLVLAIVDGDGVVVPVEAVDKGLNGRLLEVTQH